MIGKHTALDRLVETAQSGRISRRQFMANAAAAGIFAGGAGALWTKHAWAQQPRHGGTFRWGVHDGATTDSHDPGRYNSHQMIYLGHQYRSYLTLIESDNTLGPDLATEWKASPDATQWTFRLNENASFHSGKKVTSKDVVASLNHHRGDDSTSAAKPLLADVDTIEADGEHAVIITLVHGSADLPWLMTDYHLAICPAKDDGSIDWQSGDGSGPFKIDQGEFGVQWNLSRHEGWHLEGPYFDNLRIVVLNDPNARSTALITGEVDAVSQIDLKVLALLQQRPDIEIDNVPSGSAVCMPMHCNAAPFDDVNVRNALKLAINREEIVDKITFGTATVGNDFHISPIQPHYPEGIPQREYDPEQARSLLKKAGHENLTIDLSSAEGLFPGAVDMCVLYAEQARAAGININVVRETNDGYYDNVWLKKPFCVVPVGARPVPDMIFSLVYAADAPWNDTYWRNERFNELLVASRSELDVALRAEMYSDMCMEMRDDGGVIIPFFQNFVYARKSNVKRGPDLAANWECDGARAPSRWWFGD